MGWIADIVQAALGAAEIGDDVKGGGRGRKAEKGATRNEITSTGGGRRQVVGGGGGSITSGPGYLVVGPLFWLNPPTSRITVTGGKVLHEGRELPGGRPVPNYDARRTEVVTRNGRMFINNVPIPEYVAPTGPTGNSIQVSGNVHGGVHL